MAQPGPPGGDSGPHLPAERRRAEEGRHRQDAAGREDGAVLPARGARVGLPPPHQPAAVLLLLRWSWRVRRRGAAGRGLPDGRGLPGGRGSREAGARLAGVAGPPERSPQPPTGSGEPEASTRGRGGAGGGGFLGAPWKRRKCRTAVNSLVPSVHVLPAPYSYAVPELRSHDSCPVAWGL